MPNQIQSSLTAPRVLCPLRKHKAPRDALYDAAARARRVIACYSIGHHPGHPVMLVSPGRSRGPVCSQEGVKAVVAVKVRDGVT